MYITLTTRSISAITYKCIATMMQIIYEHDRKTCRNLSQDYI